MIKTFSIFYYGQDITDSNNKICFSEGGPELIAEVEIGAYTLNTLPVAIETALNNIGALTYTVSVNRTTRLITISANSTFSLLTATGSSIGTSIFSMIGFEAPDKTGASSYTGTLPCGYAYEPQFKLQDYISPDYWKKSADQTVNKTATGRVEIVKFGIEKFMQANIRFITNIGQPSGYIKNNQTGLQDAIQFMDYLITKNPVEFISNIDNRSSFLTVILESTPDESTGTGYRLKELYDKGAIGYYDTGILKFRVIE